jgi:hypothetical protein
MSKQIQATEIIDLGPAATKKERAVHHKGKALRPTDGDIKAIGVEKELGTSWRLGAP